MYAGGSLSPTHSSAPVHSPTRICPADETRPVILCEYSHSMGNSTGNIHKYWAAFEGHPYAQVSTAQHTCCLLLLPERHLGPGPGPGPGKIFPHLLATL